MCTPLKNGKQDQLSALIDGGEDEFPRPPNSKERIPIYQPCAKTIRRKKMISSAAVPPHR